MLYERKAYCLRLKRAQPNTLFCQKSFNLFQFKEIAARFYVILKDYDFRVTIGHNKIAPVKCEVILRGKRRNYFRNGWFIMG
jgi:hypothetical protein